MTTVEEMAKQHDKDFPKEFKVWSEYGWWLEKLTTLETKVREDERQKVLEKVEKLINKRCFLHVIGSKQYSIIDADELRIKLNQLKET